MSDSGSSSSAIWSGRILHKANDCRTSNSAMDRAKAPTEPVIDFKPEIESIIDFRVLNGVEQYLVNWKCYVNDKRSTWEGERVLDSMCHEKLVKFWVKSLLTHSVNPGEPPIIKDIVTKKLWEWILPPSSVLLSDTASTSADCKPNPQLACYPKKRSRQSSSIMDTEDDIHYEIEKKQPKMVSDDEMISLVKAEDSLSFPPEKCMKMEELTDPFDIPPYEVGEIINCKKRMTDNEIQNEYFVTWFYFSHETADTLGLNDSLLQKHFHLCSEDRSNSEQKFQLQRKRRISSKLPLEAAILKPAGKKFSSSESDLSSASTHPPSEPEISGEKVNDYVDSIGTAGEMLVCHAQNAEEFEMDSTSEIGCQTTIEVDPYVCQYCQNKMGETERLSSLRQRKIKKEPEDEYVEKKVDSKLQKQKKSSKAPVYFGDIQTGNEGEEDDDDLVPIEYEVEQILNYKRDVETNVDQYFIRWKGFTPDYDTWEPESNLSCCNKLLITFFVNRVGERRNFEVEQQKQKQINNGGVGGKKLPKIPELPPLPEDVIEELGKLGAPVTDEEIQEAYRISKITKKGSRWSKKKLRKMLLDLTGLGDSVPSNDLPNLRHQVLMLESERRKEIVLEDLKRWEKQLNAIANGRPEIVVENNYDLSGPPTDFKYTNDNVIGEGVNFPDDTLEGCNCQDSCVKDSPCCPGKHGKVLAYTSLKRLRVLPGYPIYECNKRCKCGPDCANRVVQDGTTSLFGTKLCIFRTPNMRGWGVKTLKKIKKGAFVCLYAGEIITSEEAENRGQIYENQLGACYLFDLDYYAEDKESCPYTIDATKMGNIAHFINHSCDPNLSVFNVWADCVDQNLPKLAFFALRDISKDEELTYDYGTHDDAEVPPSALLSTPTKAVLHPGITDASAESDNNDISNSMISVSSSPAKNRMKPATVSTVRRPCLCGAKNCRKVLF